MLYSVDLNEQQNHLINTLEILKTGNVVGACIVGKGAIVRVIKWTVLMMNFTRNK